jgi:hypothetical protein
VPSSRCGYCGEYTRTGCPCRTSKPDSSDVKSLPVVLPTEVQLSGRHANNAIGVWRRGGSNNERLNSRRRKRIASPRYFAYCRALKMEAGHSSETSVNLYREVQHRKGDALQMPLARGHGGTGHGALRPLQCAPPSDMQVNVATELHGLVPCICIQVGVTGVHVASRRAPCAAR